MAKKTKFAPDFSLSDPNFGPQTFLVGCSLQYQLDTLASHNCMQFQGKLMYQTSENAKNLVSGPIMIPLAQMWAQKIPFRDFISTTCQTLLQAIIVCNFKKTKERNLRKQQKTQFQVQNVFFIDFTSASCQKLLQVMIIRNFMEN